MLKRLLLRAFGYGRTEESGIDMIGLTKDRYSAQQRIKFYLQGLYYASMGYWLRNVGVESKVFQFNNQTFYYYYGKEGYAYRNERAIEIPIAKQYLEEYWKQGNIPKIDVLEIGNVLSQYYRFYEEYDLVDSGGMIGHTIVDKYERGEDVINEDLLDFDPHKKYGFIISISTLEHIGLDEQEPINPAKSLKAFKKIYQLLKLHGTALITVPLGYNTEIDRLIYDGILENEFNGIKIYFMLRISYDNLWLQVSDFEEKPKYGHPFNGDNAIAVIIMRKS